MKTSSKPPRALQRGRSFRDIQGFISKMNPDVIRNVIANGASKSPVSSSNPVETLPSPVCDPTLSLSCGYENDEQAAPMTIFYDGKVSVFQVSPHKAQDLLRAAEQAVPDKFVEFSSGYNNTYSRENLVESVDGDFPVTRRRSLERFLEKRKGRFTSVSPCE